MHTLFRKEAIHASRNNQQSEVLVSRRFSIVYWVLAFLAVGLFSAIVLLEYSRHITVIGTLKSSGGSVKVFARETAQVAAVYVHEGQPVKENQSIALVRLPSHLYRLNQSKQDELQWQIEQIQKQVRKNKKQYAFTKELTHAQYEMVKQEKEQLVVSTTIQKEQVDLRQQQLEKARLLHQQDSMSQRQFEVHLEAFHTAQLQLQRYLNESQQKNTQLAVLNKELHLLEVNHEQQIVSLETEIQNASMAKKQLADRNEYAIRAPVAGIVTNIQMMPGQLTKPDKPLVFILSKETNFFAELFIPSRHIGFLTKELPVKLKLDAYPYQKFGISHGVIHEVSQAAMNFKDVDSLFSNSEPMYRVRINLAQQHLDYKNERLGLKDGMKVIAEINLERRRIMHWLMSPLYELTQHA